MSQLLSSLKLMSLPPLSSSIGVGRFRLPTWQLAYGGSPEAVAFRDRYRAEMLEAAAKAMAGAEGLPIDARAALAAWWYRKLQDDAQDFVLDPVPAGIAQAFGRPTVDFAVHKGVHSLVEGDRVYNWNPSSRATIGCYGHVVDGELMLQVFLHIHA